MAKVTITLEDNPLAGRPGQGDMQLTAVSSDPPFPMPPGEDTVEQLTPAQGAAIAALAHVADLSYETAWMLLDQGVEN